MNKNLLFFARIGGGVAAVGFMAFAASAYAMTPTLSFSSTSGNSVEVTVSGDANSNVVFYYNVASASGMQTQSLGSTNASGYFSTTISPSNIIAGDNTYVIVDGQQSPMQVWPTPTGVPSLNQTSVTIGLGQSVSVYSEGSSAAVYAASNSNPSAASVSVNGTQITIVGNQTGSTNVSVCYAGTASNCANLYINVQAGSVLTFSQSNPTVAVGQGISVSLSGGNGSYSITGNSNPSYVSAILSGNTITLTGSALGTANITACDSSGNCGTLYVTVSSTGTSGSALYFSNTNPTVAVGQVTTVTVSNGSNYYVTGNSNTNVAAQSISGNMLTISGLAAGNTTITVCSASNGCGSIAVTVGTSNSNEVMFGITNPTITVGQSATISLSGGSGYYISSNSNSNIIQPSINGTNLVLYGSGAGSASVVVCASGGSCNTLYVTVVTGTTSTASGNVSSASLLSAIQSMQAQLGELVTQIQSMAATLTQLATSAGATANTGTTTSGTTTATAGTYDFTEFLGVGSQDAQVTELQNYLTQKGYYNGPITGYFGALTENAVAAYQSAHGISAVGYVGPSTRAAMNAGE